MVDCCVAWYGRSGLLKSYCNKCKGYFFVVDNEFQCCGKEINEEKIVKGAFRISGSERGRISAKLKRKILFSQKYRCHYCGIDLSKTWYYLDKYGDLREIKINFDHFIPASYAANESFENLYATCNLCNKYKSSKIFNSIEHLRKYLQEKYKNTDIKIYTAKEASNYER
jgi:5-methylcytosine-specific restriction endonuclease McrA